SATMQPTALWSIVTPCARREVARPRTAARTGKTLRFTSAPPAKERPPPGRVPRRRCARGKGSLPGGIVPQRLRWSRVPITFVTRTPRPRRVRELSEQPLAVPARGVGVAGRGSGPRGAEQRLGGIAPARLGADQRLESLGRPPRIPRRE